MRKLYRSNSDIKISGVCGGIAEYFGIDSTIVRLLWVLGTFMTGFFIGIVLYIACVVIIPVDSGYIDGTYEEKK